MRQHPLRPRRTLTLLALLGVAAAAAAGCGTQDGARTFRVFVTCSPNELYGDGSNFATCSVQVLDQDNSPAEPGTRVVFLSQIVGTATPSGGFGTELTPTAERFVDESGSATIEFRCTGVGTIGVIAATEAGDRGAASVTCAEISGDWVIVRVAPDQPGIRPNESTNVCAWAETGDGEPVPPGTVIRFTHNATNGGFGGSFADSRTDATDGVGKACVTYVAQSGDYRETVTITANFNNTSFGNDPKTAQIIVDSDLPENEILCSVDPDTLLADGTSTSTLSITAFGTGSAPASGVDVNCDVTGSGSLSNNGVATTDGDGQATLVVTSGTDEGTAQLECTADQIGAAAVCDIDVEIITVGEVVSLGSSKSPLGVRGSGVDETAEVCFQVNDQNGQPFPEGHRVDFDLTGSDSDGVALLDLQENTDEAGQACTTVQAGATFGTAVVNATVRVGSNEVTGSESVPVRGVVPSRGGMTLTCAQRNIGALRYQFGTTIQEPDTGNLCTTCELRLRDAANNLVGFEKVVTFRAESGRFSPSAQTHNNLEGIASVIWCADGNPPIDVAPLQGEPSWVETDTGDVRNPRDGLVTIIAYVQGDEELLDINGNGRYDVIDGDDFWDLPEPFVDVNDNNVYDFGLDNHVDIEGRTPGVWDNGDVAWTQDTVIWVQTRLLLTGSPYFDLTNELAGTDASWPMEDTLPFDDDYPDPARLSHWYVTDTADTPAILGNFYSPDTVGGVLTCAGPEGYCLVAPESWSPTNRLRVSYVMRDRNGNAVNASLTGVSYQWDQGTCSSAVSVEPILYDPGLRPGSQFPFDFQIVRDGGVGMDYSVLISNFTTGSVQTFALSPGGTGFPGLGCRFEMVAPLKACPSCGDAADTGPWPFFVIND